MYILHYIDVIYILFQAHHQHRRAELSMRNGRYKEAIERHLRAAELLEEALKHTTSIKASESIKLQRDYHLKQKYIIRLKKGKQENPIKIMEKRDVKITKAEIIDLGKETIPESLKLKVHNIMDDADSLVDLLVKKYNEKYDNKDPDSDIDLKQLSIIEAIYKDPKGDKTVIEELKTVNHQLREVIVQLLKQLETTEQENKELKRRLGLPANDEVPQMIPSPLPQSPQNKQTSPLAIITDSADDSSPFVYSPGSDLSPDNDEDRELPPLAPLEMPDFDYDLMMSQLRAKREENEKREADLRKHF